MVGVTVKGDLSIDRDASTTRDTAVGRDLSVTNDASVGNDLSVGLDASVGQDLSVNRDASVNRHLNAFRYSTGSFSTSDIGIMLNSASPYQIIITGTAAFPRLLTLPSVSTAAGADFGNGSGFRVTNNATNQEIKLFAFGGVGLVGDPVIGIGKTAIIFCVDAGAALQAQAWEVVVFDDVEAARTDPVSMAILNGPTAATSSWVDNNSGQYIATFQVPSSKTPSPVITIRDSNRHNILVDTFLSLGEVTFSINVTSNPDARFAGIVEFA